jgi:predicted phage tail protein
MSKVQSPTEFGIQPVYRAGALVLLVAFWFDGGLFDLVTASVFWILLELGTSHLAVNRTC